MSGPHVAFASGTAATARTPILQTISQHRINHVVALLEARPQLPIDNVDSTVTLPQPTLSPTSISGLQTSTSVAANEEAVHAPEGLPDDDMIRLDISDSAAASPNCEAILKWPIFRDVVSDVGSFILELEDDDQESPDRPKSVATGNLGRGVQEDDFTMLSKKFLAYVHVKNPILDVGDFKTYVRNAAESGPRWDGPSCLVVRSKFIRDLPGMDTDA
ncbi:hypothetical protein ColLi_12260 [Colletotrichum liriopes]|uniref:Uncharacterized protein n=1 Tax=Colletotrichum liriopes TaxID=708192 RepID=A0AA37GYN2_9PEZI|nr:hypothetical protein ColLi_12260 [Colletotrichum liriopes]